MVKGVDLSNYPSISNLIRILSLEEGIDFRETNKERRELISELEGTMSKKEREELVLKIVALKATTLSQQDFYSYLKEKADKKFINIKN